jgi:ribonucleoside-diphosphate reductase alpha chain
MTQKNSSSLLDTTSVDTKKTAITHFSIVKRNGAIVPFRKERIRRAIDLAFQDTKKSEMAPIEFEEIQTEVERVADTVTDELLLLATKGTSLTVEGIQDVVEVTLMKLGHHDVARSYIIYRDHHKHLREDSPQNLKIQRKDGSLVRFNPMKIASTIETSFRRAGMSSTHSPEKIIEAVNSLTEQVINRVISLHKNKKPVYVTTINNEIEQLLMETGFYRAAKDYILFRASLGEQTILNAEEKPDIKRQFPITTPDGKTQTVTEDHLKNRFKFACQGMKEVSVNDLLEVTISHFYEGIKEKEIDQACLMATRTKIEIEPAYAKVAARLLIDIIYKETMEIGASDNSLVTTHKAYFKKYIQLGVSLQRLSPSLLEFDLDYLNKAIDLRRDDLFSYLGIQTLYDRYLIHNEERKIETPQIFWMRVAMGLSLNEGKNKNERAVEFYNILSQLLFISSTPTLFNAGTLHCQLSSCYLSTVQDDLSNIFKVIADDAQLSKWAGGIGNDWTNVRGTGSFIKGTNGKSQGIIPFLKVANDTAVAVNQGGKRKGAMCAYLETWHIDIEDFLELRKNTGDERRRTHDMNTANWIPDLFMKRVAENGMWTLFSPSDVPDLHHLYGQEFEKRYVEYEKKAEEKKIKIYKKVFALDLWRKMLSMLFETGHPWITFKDPSNIRSPQDHVGVVYCSNLCTEILLNTSEEETAVCNLGSINLKEHCNPSGLDEEKIARTIRTAIRMLDNVVDINFYPTKEAKNANLSHRPIGLGIMGFQDALYIQNISYASHEAVEFADSSMEMISYYAILASTELAQERGTYNSYKGSKWDRGLFPIDTIHLLEKERGGYIEMDQTSRMDWQKVRGEVKKHGMRNSNLMAIAPTATISNIVGTSPCIEPQYKHLFVKSNLSGEFTIPNIFLVEKLKALQLWDQEMLDDLKYFDGSIAEIDRIPEEIKQVHLNAFEIDPEWLIECASRRQKWIDMGQSLNLYIAEPNGKKLHQMYTLAWLYGLKTTYYLRNTAATQIEKSTTDINKRGIQPRWMKNKSASNNIIIQRENNVAQLCKIDDTSCESCQ